MIFLLLFLSSCKSIQQIQETKFIVEKSNYELSNVKFNKLFFEGDNSTQIKEIFEKNNFMIVDNVEDAGIIISSLNAKDGFKIIFEILKRERIRKKVFSYTIPHKRVKEEALKGILSEIIENIDKGN